MVVFFVSGGSYKFFYLNYFLKLKKCDLLIFNYDIFNSVNSKIQIDYFYNEIKLLGEKLNCPIVVGAKFNTNKTKRLIYYNLKIIYNFSFKKDITIRLKNKKYLIQPYHKTRLINNRNVFCKIVLSEEKLKVDAKSCSINKKYIFCDKQGLTFVENKKLKRNFNKCSKIILK